MKKCLALALSILMLVTILPMVLTAGAAVSATVSAAWENGMLTFTWTGADGYVAKMAKIGENELAVSAKGAGSATAIFAGDCSDSTISLGFAESASADVTEWVTVSELTCSFDVQINAYKSNNNLLITVLDEHDNPVPAGQTLDITLEFASGGSGRLMAKTAEGGTTQVSLSNYNNLASASVSIASFTVGKVTYAGKSVSDIDLSVEDQTVQTQMSLTVENGKATATVTDDAGNPMAGVTVVLDFGSMVDYDTQITDENGQAFFTVAASSKAKIVCRVADWNDKHIVYKGCSATYGGTSSSTSNSTTTTKRPTNTTTKRPTKPSHTTTTHDVIIGAGTTAYPSEYADYVAVDAIFDSGVLEAFGIRESEFANRAQLLIKREEYDRWVGEEGAALMLSVRFSNAQVDAGQIHNAIKDDYELMSFDANEVAHVSASLSAQIRTADGDLITLMLDDSEYIVRLPIPKNMSKATLIMVSQQLENALSTPVGVSSKDGYFEFTTANLADLTFLGFVVETETDNNYFVFTIILVAVGVVLLIGAVLILYFCVLRKPKSAKKVEEDEMTDLYSDDLPMGGDVNEDGDIVIAPMEDVIDLPPQKFADDIMMPDFSEEDNG